MSPNQQFAYPGDSNFGYTIGAEELARLRQQAEASQGKAPRPTIGSDRRIQGGVYEGLYGGEAIVVDYNEDPELIDAAVSEVMGRATKKDGTVDKSEALWSVYDVVTERMQYDQDATDEILKSQGGKDGTKVSLSVYIEKGKGVCRHQALFAGTLLERLVDTGVLNGQVSVDRSERRAAQDDSRDGHAWVRYTTSSGEVIILDPAQQKMDTLENLRDAYRKNPYETWDYARDEDKMRGVVKTAEVLPQVDLEPFKDENGIINRVPW